MTSFLIRLFLILIMIYSNFQQSFNGAQLSTSKRLNGFDSRRSNITSNGVDFIGNLFEMKNEETATQQQESVPRFACYLCKKKFSKSKLRLHMNIHTGSKKYTCHLCEKSYRHPAHFKAHRKTCRLDLSLLAHT